ncbi:acyltransferase [Pseudoroseomonas cervicalis]|uniref:acyltransferase family protein n=1 Tax=Teichococcus cervicalis TaxID=204525 RepID=UPI002783ABD5|nr:acyltransferase [Pseudoroseomonas cervicalis]MDQ1081528.1 exopolysaccharide production protein ExoZ [Pseudoroseomonas cervicalis]
MPPLLPARRLPVLDAGRGIAALLVMLFHISDTAFQNMFGQRPVGAAFAFGYAGLDFFFVLSGFIIMHGHAGDLGRPGRVLPYLRKRISRVYPAYWVVTLLYAGLAAAGPGLPPGQFAASLLLLPGQPLLLGVAWTLVHEMLFYLLFALAILAPRAGLALGLAWVALSLLLPRGIGALADVLFELRHVEFLIGVLAAWAVRHAPPRRPLALAAAGGGLFALTAGLDVLQAATGGSALPPQGFILAYGLASGALIAGLAAREAAAPLRLPRPLLMLGEASYSLYLTHLLAYSLLARLALALHLPALLPGWALLALLAAGITAAGLLFHRLVERPLLRLARGTGPVIAPHPTATA